MLLANLFIRLCIIRVLTMIKQTKFCSEEVRSDLAKETAAAFSHFLLVHAYHVIRCLIARSFLTRQQKLIRRGQRQSVLRPKSIHSILVSRNSALYLADFRWDRTHIHLFQFFDWCKRIEKFGYEGIV